jgi:hypothetical protein
LTCIPSGSRIPIVHYLRMTDADFRVATPEVLVHLCINTWLRNYFMVLA